MTRELALGLLRSMYRIRLFEEKIEYLFKRGRLGGTVHLCIGQEACAAGVCAALRTGDVVGGTHRGHGHAIAKGLELDRLFAELMGRSLGYCKGKGGTQHVASFHHGFLGTNGITGGGIPIITGAALGFKLKELPQVAVSFFGDGAVNQGVFHEALNFASIWELPVVYVCENNLYAMSAHVDDMLGAESIVARAQSYRIDAVRVDGMDVCEVHGAAARAVERARTERRPAFIECLTYRFAGHSKSDARRYRTKEEERAWRDRDPIDVFQRRLTEREGWRPEEVDAVKSEIARQVEDAAERAFQAAESAPEELFQDVYAQR
jgi:pyruvate dehydrogenase E1 component alpha subunit